VASTQESRWFSPQKTVTIFPSMHILALKVLLKKQLSLTQIIGNVMSLDVVIFRPSWQVMRVSTLKENNPYGGLLTVAGADDAINRLNNYISDVSPQTTAENTRMQITDDEEYACRIYRVSNFLQATINGIVSQNLPHTPMLRAYADQLHPLTNNHLVMKVANKWDWDVVRFELEDLWIKERSWFSAILTDIEERIKEKNNDSPELLYFHRLLQEVNS